ncbi:MAG: hypothetical protein KF680_07740 [Cryobacterium sp.]|nr:hypothetical protein [Cryobacterium sp.]
MTTWEIRPTGYEVPVLFAELQHFQAATSEEALAVYRQRLAELIDTSEDEVELDLLTDLRDTEVSAIPLEPASTQPAPSVLDPASAAVRRVAGDGFEFMDANRALGWRQVPSWGRDGYDMGRWPGIVVMTNDDYARPRALVYFEGDVQATEFNTVTERDNYLDHVAETFWRSGEADGPRDLALFEQGQLPPQYRGQPAPLYDAVPAAAHTSVAPSVAPARPINL